MKYSELKRLLTKNGCYLVEEGGNHETWYSPITQDKVPVGRHDSQEVKTGTLNRILKQAGIKKR